MRRPRETDGFLERKAAVAYDEAMSRKRYLTAAIIAGAIFLLFFIFFEIPLPSRTVVWESSESFAPSSILNFFSGFFPTQSVSFLILGVPGEPHGGPLLSDTIILFHTVPDRQKIFSVSFPRDLWVADKEEQFKINESVVKKKIPILIDKIKEMSGITSDGYVIVDLAQVENAVDFLGGIRIILNEPAMDWVSGFTLDKGEHFLDGRDVSWLLRNRFSNEGDFFRERNQQKVIVSIFESFKKLSEERKLEFLKKFVFTTETLKNARIDFSAITSLIFRTDAGKFSIESIVLDGVTKLFSVKSIPVITSSSVTSVSVVVPTAGFERYEEIKKFIQTRIESH